MFKPEQYRAKAAEYTEMLVTATAPEKVSELQQLEKSFTERADNEQLLADTYRDTVLAPPHDRTGGATLAEEEKHILRCLGAALIMRWNTLPRQLRRELFDDAGAMGELVETANLRAQIARFLHRHKDDGRPEKSSSGAERQQAIARWDNDGGAAPILQNSNRP